MGGGEEVNDMHEWFENAFAVIVKVVAALGGFLSGALGRWDACLSILLACMVIDYVSGMIVALMGKSDKTENGGLSSNAGMKGLLKKGMMLLIVLVAALLDAATGGEANMFRNSVCWFYIANESLSILENATRAGVPWPESIKNLLMNVKKKNNTKPEEQADEKKEE